MHPRPDRAKLYTFVLGKMLEVLAVEISEGAIVIVIWGKNRVWQSLAEFYMSSFARSPVDV